MKTTISLLFAFILAISLNSCTADKDSSSSAPGGDVTTGNGMFWIASDLQVGNISVTCNGSTQIISAYYSSGAPSCGASGCANFTLNPGTYSYNASAGSTTWSGTITITSGGCSKQQLSGSGGGGGTGNGMFWIASDLQVGNISVTCNGSTQIISSYYSAGAPSCGASGCANFTLTPGTYSYNASAGSTTWSGTITITSGGCSKQQLIGSSGGGGGSFNLNGNWSSGGLGITIAGSTGVLYSLSTNWQIAANGGWVSIGSYKVRNISAAGTNQWSCQELWCTTTNGVIDGVLWSSDGTIVMSTNGNSLTITSTGPLSGNSRSLTYNRVP